MFVITKTSTQKMQALIPGQSIFLRPTPWKEAWKAGFDYVRCTGQYCFVYLPHEFANPDFEYRLELRKEVAIFEQGKEIARIPIQPLAFWPWMFYGIESFAYGFFQRFWAWRWDGKPTRQELEQRIEELEAALTELLDRDA